MQDIRSSDPKALVRALFAPIAEDMAAVDAIIREELDSDVPRMREIGEHIVNAGGKRMRPALLMLICRALGYEGELHRYLGATIELLHTATLMHDDVVDESAVRRGKPTANALWGNGVAVLVGDFLYTRSFQMMIRAGNLRVMQALADAANTLAEGEVKQMVNAHDPTVDEKRYFEVIERKTACLFEAGAKMAAAIADCSEKDEAAVREYALALGNAFQIVDDALDFAPSSLTGKPEGGDVREGKLTPPIFFYADSLAPAERDAFFARFAEQSFTDEDVRHVIDAVRAQGFDDKTRGIADSYLHKAQENLDALTAGLPASPYGEILTSFIGYVRNRDA